MSENIHEIVVTEKVETTYRVYGAKSGYQASAVLALHLAGAHQDGGPEVQKVNQTTVKSDQKAPKVVTKEDEPSFDDLIDNVARI